MKIEYDPEVDALYIQLAGGEVEQTEEIKSGMMVDSGKSGNFPGIEVLNASKRGKLRSSGATADPLRFDQNG